MSEIPENLLRQIRAFFVWLQVQIINNPLGLLIVSGASLLFGWMIWETVEANNLGFEDKTLWDWMELLIVSFVLSIGIFFLNQSARKNEQEIARVNRKADLDRAIDQQGQSILDKFIDSLSELMLDHVYADVDDQSNEEKKVSDTNTEPIIHENLSLEYGQIENPKNSVSKIVKSITTARAITALDKLDGKRKGLLVKFLFDSECESWVNFFGANLDEVELKYVDMIGGNFYGTTLRESNFKEATLINMDLGNCILFGANFENAELNKTNLGGSFFDSESNLKGLKLNDVDLTSAYLAEVKMRNVTIRNCFTDIKKVFLSRAFLQSATIEDSIFPNADLNGADLSDSILTRVDLREAYLANAIFHNAELRECKLAKAVLREADFTNVYLDSVDFSGADMSGIDVRGTDLSRTNLNGTILEDAISDSNTKWPSDFQFATKGRG